MKARWTNQQLCRHSILAAGWVQRLFAEISASEPNWNLKSQRDKNRRASAPIPRGNYALDRHRTDTVVSYTYYCCDTLDTRFASDHLHVGFTWCLHCMCLASCDYDKHEQYVAVTLSISSWCMFPRFLLRLLFLVRLEITARLNTHTGTWRIRLQSYCCSHDSFSLFLK